MWKFKKYEAPATLEECYQLLTKGKRNVILGGSTFMRTTQMQNDTAISLKNLGLDRIEETENGILIGALCTLRQAETSPILQQYCGGAASAALSSIAGVQFRSVATMGASVYSKYGFSDVITPLLAYHAKVELYHQGIMTLQDYLSHRTERDILVHIILPKQEGIGAFHDCRVSTCDFSMLNVAVYCSEDCCRICLGARPGKAKLAEQASAMLTKLPACERAAHAAEIADLAVSELHFESNMRASREYREHLGRIYVKRLIAQCCGGKNHD